MGAHLGSFEAATARDMSDAPEPHALDHSHGRTRALRGNRPRNLAGEKLRRAWSRDEDEALVKLVEEHGPSKWNRISAEFNALQLGAPRDPKACRLRWSNQLDTRLNHGPFTEEENQKIIEMHAIHGNKWAQIAAALPGRTDNAVKNQWNCKLAKRVNEQSGSPDSTPRGARASGHGVTQDFSGIPPQGMLKVDRSVTTSWHAGSPRSRLPAEDLPMLGLPPLGSSPPSSLYRCAPGVQAQPGPVHPLMEPPALRRPQMPPLPSESGPSAFQSFLPPQRADIRAPAPAHARPPLEETSAWHVPRGSSPPRGASPDSVASAQMQLQRAALGPDDPQATPRHSALTDALHGNGMRGPDTAAPPASWGLGWPGQRLPSLGRASSAGFAAPGGQSPTLSGHSGSAWASFPFRSSPPASNYPGDASPLLGASPPAPGFLEFLEVFMAPHRARLASQSAGERERPSGQEREGRPGPAAACDSDATGRAPSAGRLPRDNSPAPAGGRPSSRGAERAEPRKPASLGNTLLGMMTGTSADAQERELARLTRPLGQLPGDEDAANAMMSLSSSPPGPSPNPSEVAPAHGWWHGTWSEMARAGAAPAGGSEGALGVSIGPFGGSVGPLGVSMGALAAGEVDDGRGVVTSPAAPSAAVSPSHGPGGSSDGSRKRVAESAGLQVTGGSPSRRKVSSVSQREFGTQQ